MSHSHTEYIHIRHAPHSNRHTDTYIVQKFFNLKCEIQFVLVPSSRLIILMEYYGDKTGHTKLFSRTGRRLLRCSGSTRRPAAPSRATSGGWSQCSSPCLGTQEVSRTGSESTAEQELINTTGSDRETGSGQHVMESLAPKVV